MIKELCPKCGYAANKVVIDINSIAYHCDVRGVVYIKHRNYGG